MDHQRELRHLLDVRDLLGERDMSPAASRLHSVLRAAALLGACVVAQYADALLAFVCGVVFCSLLDAWGDAT